MIYSRLPKRTDQYSIHSYCLCYKFVDIVMIFPVRFADKSAIRARDRGHFDGLLAAYSSIHDRVLIFHEATKLAKLLLAREV